jgi:hypothetical protein
MPTPLVTAKYYPEFSKNLRIYFSFYSDFPSNLVLSLRTQLASMIIPGPIIMVQQAKYLVRYYSYLGTTWDAGCQVGHGETARVNFRS